MSAVAASTGGATASAAPARSARRSPLQLACLAPAVIFFGLFFVGPLIYLILLGFWRVENFSVVADPSLVNYADIAANFAAGSNYGWAILQTLYVATTTALIATALCYLMALAIVFAVPQRWQRLVVLLAVAPFWTSYILRVYAWQVLLAKRGVINSFMAHVGLPDVQLGILYTQTATRIGLIHYLAPILIVILFVAIASIDRTLIEAARELGATRLQVLRRVILPLSRAGIALSLSFAAIVACGDVLSGSLLGGGAGESLLGKLPLYANMILRAYASSTNLPHTAALAMVLVLLMTAILLIGTAATNRARVEER